MKSISSSPTKPVKGVKSTSSSPTKPVKGAKSTTSSPTKPVKGVKSASSSPTKPINTGYRLPTYTHEAICKLIDMGIMKYLISQNTDGLHRLSGIPAEKISELHGNGFEEKCEKCKTRRMTKSNVRSDQQKKKVLNKYLLIALLVLVSFSVSVFSIDPKCRKLTGYKMTTSIF